MASRKRTFTLPDDLAAQLLPSPPLLIRVHCAGRDVVAVTDQIRAVAKERLDKRMGELSREHLEAVEEGLREILELR